jgi:hypothetical protein
VKARSWLLVSFAPLPLAALLAGATDGCGGGEPAASVDATADGLADVRHHPYAYDVLLGPPPMDALPSGAPDVSLACDPFEGGVPPPGY